MLNPPYRKCNGKTTLERENNLRGGDRDRLAPERAAYLDRACAGNHEVRQEVYALLKAHQDAGSFLEQPPARVDATLDVHPVAERAGQTIGRYKLLEEIGDGGMGVVFMAEQRRAVRRKVALKIIKPGMDTVK